MPRLREDKRPDAVIDLRHGSLQRARTGEVVLADEGLPEVPPPPVFAHEPVVLDGPGSTRKRRRVAELEEIVATNARAALEARAIALEQRRHLEAATDALRSTTADLADLRRDLKNLAATRADLIAKERARAEHAARSENEAQLHLLEADRAQLQTEIDRLRVELAAQQGLNGENTQRLRDEQRERADAEKEAKRAIAAYETAERRLDTASEALHRHAAEEQARIEAAEAARVAAEAELEALGGGGQVAKLTNRVEDLVQQLGELDAELAASEARAETEVVRIREQLDAVISERDVVIGERDAVIGERDALRVEAARLVEIGEQQEADATDALVRSEATVSELEAALASARGEADDAKNRATDALVRSEATVSELEAALASARGEADDAKNRATVARVRLDEMVSERDALLATITNLEEAAEARERRAADELARAEAALELADPTDLEAALVAARFDAEALRGETIALAAQLEDAWSQVEDARRAVASARESPTADPTDPSRDDDTSVDVASTESSDASNSNDSLLDTFADLVATPEAAGDDEERVERPVDHEVRIAPPAPDPEDRDARRAALGFLNSLARDLPNARPR